MTATKKKRTDPRAKKKPVWREILSVVGTFLLVLGLIWTITALLCFLAAEAVRFHKVLKIIEALDAKQKASNVTADLYIEPDLGGRSNGHVMEEMPDWSRALNEWLWERKCRVWEQGSKT